MAITLKVEDYCQNCPDFEADVDKETLYCRDDFDIFEPLKHMTETTVTCKHRDRCACVKEYIERNMKKNDTAGKI